MNRGSSGPWLPRPGLVVGLAGMALLLSAGPVHGYTARRVALDSNILVYDGKVIFAQGTGSLTVLDLQTGEVLLRKKRQKDFWYSGTLEHCGEGVLMIDYSRIALLDEDTFDPLWQADKSYDAVADGNHVVSHDGDHTVSCRKVGTGELCWTVEMEAGWHVLAAKGKALVATPDFWDGRSALMVLDLQSGRRLLDHQAPPGVHWLQVYFDGERVYVVDAGPPRFSAEPGTLTALNLQGKVVGKVDADSPEVVPSSTEHWNGRFFWDGKFFSHDGRVRPVYAHEPESLVEYWRREETFPESLPSGVFVRSYHVIDISGERGQLLQMIMSNKSWGVYAPHLDKDGYVYQVTEAEGKLLLGDSKGHMECLDVETGRPRWIYKFPLIRRTMSYSTPHGMPPYLTQQAAEYREGAWKMELACGSVPLPEDFDPASGRWSELRDSTEYAGRILFDPSPDDPFANLWVYFLWLAFYALLPIIGVPLLFLRTRGRAEAPERAAAQRSGRKGPGFASLAAWCLLLSFSPALGLLQYGRVSFAWTLALKVLFVLAILCAAYGVVRLYLEKRWAAASVLTAILIAWVYLMRYPWWFA